MQKMDAVIYLYSFKWIWNLLILLSKKFFSIFSFCILAIFWEEKNEINNTYEQNFIFF